MKIGITNKTFKRIPTDFNDILMYSATLNLRVTEEEISIIYNHNLLNSELHWTNFSKEKTIPHPRTQKPLILFDFIRDDKPEPLTFSGASADEVIQFAARVRIAIDAIHARLCVLKPFQLVTE